MTSDFLAAFEFALELSQAVARGLLLAATSATDVIPSKSDVKKPMKNDTIVIVADASVGTAMYTLQKAKEEIDAVAKHATDIAVHAIAMGDKFDVRLESFKKEIIDRIDAKFTELEKMFLGESRNVETTAVADLGAKVSELLHGGVAPVPQGERHEGEHHEGEHHEGEHHQGEHHQGDGHDPHAEHHQ